MERITITLLLLLILCMLSFYVGPKIYPLADFAAILTGTADVSVYEIIVQYRGIRTLVAMFAGGAIATAGLILQAITRNVLASPSIMAMNAGGALFITIALSLGVIHSTLAIPFVAMIGASLVGVLVFMVSLYLQKYHKNTVLILVGAIMASTIFGIVQLMMIVDETDLQITLAWLYGSFNNRSFVTLQYSAILVFALTPILCYVRNHISVLSLSDTMAASVGARVRLVRVLSFFVAGGLSGMSVALAGPVAFIGLLMPHATRHIVKTIEFKKVLVPNIFLGMILALGSDIVSRLVMHPAEVSVGIILSFLGAPFLLFLLYQKRIT